MTYAIMLLSAKEDGENDVHRTSRPGYLTEHKFAMTSK
jgi:hypothetical protein